MWRLEALRTAFVGQGLRGPLPAPVLSAWRSASAGKLPSKKQIAVLQELLERRGSLWVTVRLTEQTDDPFAAMLAVDREQSVQHRAGIFARGRAWEEEKRRCREPLAGRQRALERGTTDDGLQAIGSILRGLLPAADSTTE